MRAALLSFLVACGGGKTGDDTAPSNKDGGGNTDPVFLHDLDGDGYIAEEDDCDDSDPDVHPGADERCNGIDDDCDLEIDEDAVDPPTWYLDADLDGYGDPRASVTSCDAPTGYIADGGDCDDGSDAAHPGAADVPCDGLDNDCDASTFEAGAVTLDSAPQPDLPTAIGAAGDGSVIALCEGQYVVPELGLDRSIAIRGLGVPEVTVIRGSGNGALFRVLGGTPVFDSVSLAGGTGHAAGGGDTEGGAVWVDDGQTLALANALVSGNKAGYGGGIWLGQDASLTAVGSRIDDNSGDAGGALISDGGGIYASARAVITLDDSHVDGNDAGLCGGLELIEDNSVVGANASTIDGNTSTSLQGGGVCVEQGATITGLEISGNTSSNTAGGIFAYAGLTLTDVTLSGNYSPLDGGAITAVGNATLTRVVIDGNTGDIDGSALSVSGGSTVTLIDSTVTGNGSSFFAALGAVLLADSTVVSTNTDWGQGGSDNSPADVGLVFSSKSFTFDGVADFTCSDTTGTCQ